MSRLLLETAEGHEGVHVVRLNSGAQNRFDATLLLELIECLKQLKDDDAVKAVVFVGATQKYFSTGMNIDWMQEQDKPRIIGMVQLMHHLVYDTLFFPKPIVGAINGHCFGFGAIWACAFDFRFMNSEAGWFCFPEVEVPFEVPPTLMGHIESAVPLSVMQRVVLSAERMNAQTARSLGLVRDIIHADKVLETSVDFAEILSKKNPRNYLDSKIRLRERFAADLMEGREAEFAFGL